MASGRSKKPPQDEEYYDGEEGFEEGQEGEGELEQPDLKQRFILVMSTSYGSSIVLHVFILFILSLFYIAVPQKEEEPVVIAQREVKEPEYDETLERDVVRTPRIDHPDIVEQPIIVLEEEVEITEEVPRGTDLSNLSNKNLDSRSVVDAYGIGGGAAGAYGLRTGRGTLAREGGSRGTEDAVLGALRWLARHQHPDGYWDVDGYTAECQRRGAAACNGPGFNRGDGRYDVGITGLSLLAFLGNGHTHRFGRFRQTVRRGVEWLKAQQRDDGSFGFNPDHGESTYNHAIATMAMCECYAISQDFTLQEAAQKAIRFIMEAQNPDRGWRYGYRPGNNDTSVTGWMVLALKAGHTAAEQDQEERPWGITEEQWNRAFTGARAWFDAATNARFGTAGYTDPPPGLVCRQDGAVEHRGDGSRCPNCQGPVERHYGSSFIGEQEGKYHQVPCMTAVSVICRIFTGQDKNDDVIQKGVAVLMANPVVWTPQDESPSRQTQSHINFYYWYYATYAMFQYGGNQWRDWNEVMKDALCQHQRRGGDEDGSWDPLCEWAIAGGRVYSTAINALTLEIYYRYRRAQQ